DSDKLVENAHRFYEMTAPSDTECTESDANSDANSDDTYAHDIDEAYEHEVDNMYKDTMSLHMVTAMNLRTMAMMPFLIALWTYMTERSATAI
ncbi:hypothetical protein IW147_006426, partial [Coemansia sp. RSA 720]